MVACTVTLRSFCCYITSRRLRFDIYGTNIRQLPSIHALLLSVLTWPLQVLTQCLYRLGGHALYTCSVHGQLTTLLDVYSIEAKQNSKYSS